MFTVCEKYVHVTQFILLGIYSSAREECRMWNICMWEI